MLFDTRLPEDQSSELVSDSEYGEDSTLHQQDATHQDRVLGSIPPLGTVFVEAKGSDDWHTSKVDILEEICSVFSEKASGLHLTLWEELLESPMYRDLFSGLAKNLISLKAVEYVGEDLSCTSIPVKDIKIEIYLYHICQDPEYLERDSMLQGEIITLPNVLFEGIWERLVFDKDIRGKLVRLMTNMLKFSKALTNVSRRARMNRLVLLSGACGLGKTSLSQSLAQKLSIRLNKLYASTKLIQINAATLLSKFFSESAKHILQIFTSIERLCLENPTHFICVLIDEIESLASSRTTASSRGEVQDGIRATNALLTGFDRVKSQPNLIIMCTSNMMHTLDAAFMDRCGYHIVIEEPSVAARYQILRDGIQDLIASGIITTEESKGIPSYRDAQLALLTEPRMPGSVLILLCQMLDCVATEKGGGYSARFLGQLPEVALAEHLTSDCCTLDEALAHMMRFSKDKMPERQSLKRKFNSFNLDPDLAMEIINGGKKQLKCVPDRTEFDTAGDNEILGGW